MNKHSSFSGFGRYAMLLLCLGGPVAAQAEPMSGDHDCAHHRWDPAQHEARMEEHMHALHDKLKLAPAQESAWNNFIAATKPQGRPQRDREDFSQLTAPERLDRRMEAEKEHLNRMEEHARALKAFYAQLSPEQKKTFDESFHPFGPAHRR